MNTEQKRYVFVFTGLFLVILGGLLYIRSSINSKKVAEKNAVIAYIKANKVEKTENIFVPYPRPTKLNFVYDKDIDFKRTISLRAGLKKFTGDKYLNNYRVVCGGKNCKRQVVTTKNTAVFKSVNSLRRSKVKVLNGDVMFSKGNLSALKPNTYIIGDVYIQDINFVKIPKNFRIDGNIYLINSEGLTFMGNNFIDGHIYLSGKSSVRAFPKTVKMSGQIFI